jgi:RNA polymerase sigma-70 factor (ECF subfamily)
VASSQPDSAGRASSLPADQGAASKARTLAALYDRHAAAVFGLALRMLGGPSAAEAIVEDVFTLALDRFDESDVKNASHEIAAWLLRTTHHLCLDRLGRRGTARPPEFVAPVPPLIGDEDRARRVREALQSLPAIERQVIELMYFQGLSREEIAMRVACAQSDVLHYARLGLETLHDALFAA